MADMTGLSDLVREIREALTNISKANAKNAHRLDGIEASVNELFKRTAARRLRRSPGS